MYKYEEHVLQLLRALIHPIVPVVVFFIIMAVVIAPYSHDHFQSLPDLSVARNTFAQLDGKLLVDEVFRPFFIQCGMDRTFKLAMQHRHFDILPRQKMVSYNNTTTAWDATPGEGMDEPQPTIWSFSSDGSLAPTEFKYSKGHQFVFGEKELDFVDQFKKLLDQEGLTSLFGLCEYPGDDFEGTCEITNGHANINLKPKDVCIQFSHPLLLARANLSRSSVP